MRDWREKLDAFLQFNQREILTHAGKVEKAVADQLAEKEFDQFRARRLLFEAEADAQAFDQADKKLPAKSRGRNLERSLPRMPISSMPSITFV